MTIQSHEQLMKDFETLASDEHAPPVYRASERIRQHLAAIPDAMAAPLTMDETPDCYCPEDCEMGPNDAVCPSLASVYADLLPVLLKRIGAEVK